MARRGNPYRADRILNGNQTIVMRFIGEYLDATPPEMWPPVLPTMREVQTGVADKGVSRKAAEGAMIALRSGDYPYIVAFGTGGRYSLTANGVAYLWESGYVRRFVKISDAGWGVAVPKLHLLYPTTGERSID